MPILNPPARHCLLRALFLLAASLPFSSCQQEDSAPPAPTAPSVGASALPEEQWNVDYIQGTRVGYEHTTVRPISDGDRQLLQIDVLTRISIQRFGQDNTQERRMTSIETPKGELVRFTGDSALGAEPTTVAGRVEGQQLIIETTSGGKTETSKLPWTSDTKGFNGVEQSLLASPLRPGERRMLKVLFPILNQVADVELAARDFQDTELLDGKQKLLRIEALIRLPGGAKLDSVVWTDEQGRFVKSHMDAMQIDSYRTTKEVALATTAAAKLDLGVGAIVRLDQPLPQGHATRRARYRIELSGGNPKEAFAETFYQRVKSLDEHTAEMTVEAGGVASPTGLSIQESPPGDDDRGPSVLVQSDDQRIVEMAREAQGNLEEPREIALALEQYVHRTISRKNFTQAFASAAEVAKSRQGDCTEHAVLLTALARACKLPARVAIGLVYVEGAQGFGYHMWTEVYLGGRWTPLDATLGRGGIGAAHLKLTHSNLTGSSAYSSFLPVAQVLGRLKIAVLEAE